MTELENFSPVFSFVKTFHIEIKIKSSGKFQAMRTDQMMVSALFIMYDNSYLCFYIGC